MNDECDVPSLRKLSRSTKVGVVVYGILLSHCTNCNLGFVLENGLYVKFLNVCMFPLASLVIDIDFLNLNKACFSLVVLKIT